MNLPAQVTPEIRVSHGQLLTTSLNVAQVFGKQHKNVLDAIKRLDCSEEFSRLNFKPSSYIDGRGKTQPLYDITRDGFAFLVMGFTGKEAAQWKERYIAAFNRMADELQAARLQMAQGGALAHDEEVIELQAEIIELQRFKLAVLEAATTKKSKRNPTKPLTEEQRETIRERLAFGEPRRDIARAVGCSDSAVYMIQREMRGGL